MTNFLRFMSNVRIIYLTLKAGSRKAIESRLPTHRAFHIKFENSVQTKSLIFFQGRRLKLKFSLKIHFILSQPAAPNKNLNMIQDTKFVLRFHLQPHKLLIND